MSETETTNTVTVNEPVIRYPSLASLRAAHTKLLKRFQDDGKDPKLLDEVEQFIQQAQSTGVLLDIDDDRWTSQGLLDYWAATLYRAGRTPPDTVLASFDPLLAPELKDANCPYLGLHAFHEDNKGFFFGRQRLVEDMVAMLGGRAQGERLLCVLGPSGSGKSSVVLAGLVPALRAGALHGSETWSYYKPLYPGADPLHNLAFIVRPAGEDAVEWTSRQVEAFLKDEKHLLNLVREQTKTPVLIVIDQFEEVFTLCQDDVERQAFVKNILALMQDTNDGHTVVLTLRSDFEEQIPRLPSLQPIFEKSQVRVTPLSASDLREAIEKSAELAGLKFEEGIVNELIKDILGEPAGLPLLQFTLLKLWEKRERNRVTWEAYRALGGARQALARSADALFESLIPEDQTTAKRILMRLVRPGEGREEVTSNRLQREDLYVASEARDRIDRVLDRLIKARLLLQTDDDTQESAQVEVAHEALVRNWPRLVGWLEDERISMRQRLRLTAAAELWRTHGKDPGGLLGGALLEEARNYEDLNEVEAEFVEASREFAERAEREKEEARQRELTHARERAEEQTKEASRFRKMASVLAIVFIIAMAGFVVAFIKAKEARRHARRAEAETRKAKANQLDAQARGSLDNMPDLSLLLSLEAHRIGHDTGLDIRSGLLKSLQYSPFLRTILHRRGAAVESIAYNSDGTILAVGSVDSNITLWDVKTNRQIRQLKSEAGGGVVSGAVLSIAFGPAERKKFLASGGTDYHVMIWDVETGAALSRQKIKNSTVRSLAWSRDGNILAVGTSDGSISLVNVTDPGHPSPPEILSTEKAKDTFSLAFSPDGKILAAGYRSIVVGDTETPAENGTPNQLVILWDIAARKEIARLSGHLTTVTSVAFSSDGKLLASGSLDKTIILWDVDKRRQVTRLIGQDDAVSSVAFNPDNSILASGGDKGTVLLWQLSNAVINQLPLRIKLVGHSKVVPSLAFSPDGSTLATGSEDTSVILWNISLPDWPDQLLIDKKEAKLQHEAGVNEVVFSPDGKILASGSSDLTIILWDAIKQESIRQLGPHPRRVLRLDFSPDGQVLAAASVEVDLWEVATGKKIGQLTGNNEITQSVSFSPDGKLIAAGSKRGTLLLWDAATRQQVGQFTGHTDDVLALGFSPDGKILASGGRDKKLMLWDVATRRPIREIQAHTERILCLSFSPDGQTLASGDGGHTVLLWDVATRQRRHLLSGHADKVQALAFSPDGKMLASGSYDGMIVLWDVATGERIARPLIQTDWFDDKFPGGGARSDMSLVFMHNDLPPAFRGGVNSLAFDPTGNTMASGMSDDNILLWDMNLESWKTRACRIANRNLLPSEWKTYLGTEEPYQLTCRDFPPGKD